MRNMTQDAAAERAGRITVRSYEVDLDLTGAESFLTRSRVCFDAAPGAATFLDFEGESVLSVVLNGESLPLDEVVDADCIRLGSLADVNEVVVVAVARFSNSGDGLHRFVDPIDGAVYTYTHFEPSEAQRVFACFDQPDLKAPWMLTVLAPQSWTVVSTCPPEQVDLVGAGRRRWTFPQSPTISTYLFSLAAGPYESMHSDYEGLPLALYCRASLAKQLDADAIFDLTRRGLAHYETRFGVAFPYEKYDQVFVPEFNFGGMENVGCVTMTEDLLLDGSSSRVARMKRAEIVLHELAHQWFGNLVTMQWWDDLWLNESFATFAAVQAMAEATEFTDAWVYFADSVKPGAIAEDLLASTHPVVSEAPDIATAAANFDAITYGKGAAVLQQLVARVGDDAFYAGLNAYFTKFAWANTRFGDLLACVEEAAGLDLRAWRDMWLLTSGVNILEVELDDSELVVRQSGSPLREHVLKVSTFAIEPDDRAPRDELRRTWTGDLLVAGSRTRLSMPSRVRADLVLVNDTDLTYAKVRLDPVSWQSSVSHAGLIEDPVSRVLIWNAAWDAVRDGISPVGDFMTMVSNGAPREPAAAVFERLIARGRDAALALGRQDAAGRRLRVLADLCLAVSDGSESGSDLFLAALVGFASCASSPRQLDILAGLLDDGALDLNEDQRWLVLTRLAVCGVVGPVELATQLQRDPGSRSQLSHALAFASLPDKATKASAWELVTSDDPAVPLQLRLASARGFVQREQGRILTQWTDAYFQVLVEQWAPQSSSTHVLAQLAQVAFPVFEPDCQRLLSHCDAAADVLASASPMLRRAVAGSADDVRRSMWTQALDRA